MSSPPQHWRLETDADGVAWLIFDLQGSSTNTLGDKSSICRVRNGAQDSISSGVGVRFPGGRQ